MESTITINSKQREFVDSTEFETTFLGGIGSGKTFCLGMCTLEVLKIPGTVICIAAPTTKLLNKSTLPGLKLAWNALGFLKNRDYVINKLPPKNWNVPPLGDIHNMSILTTRWGSYAVLVSLHEYDGERGIQYDEIFVDEFRDIKPEARAVLVGRARGIKYIELQREFPSEPKYKHKIKYATTPPEDPSYFQELIESNKMKFVMSTTFDNILNLPLDYIKNQKNSLDPITYKREIYALLIALGGTLFAYSFKKEKHVQKVEPNFNEPIYLSFDFNINPMTCIATQRYKGIHILQEFRLMSSNIFEICGIIKSFKDLFPFCYVTGDATGESQHANQRANVNFYTNIIEELNIKKSDVFVPSVNPHHSNSYAFINTILTYHKDLKIDPQCKFLISDLETCKVTPTLQIDKRDLSKGHLLDCFRYQLHNFDGNFKNR